MNPDNFLLGCTVSKDTAGLCARPCDFPARILCECQSSFCFVPNSNPCHGFLAHSVAACLKSYRKPSDVTPGIDTEKIITRTRSFEADGNNLCSDKKYEGVAAIVDSLKACARTKDLNGGRAIHIDIISTGLVERNAYVGSALVSLYMKCGKLSEAREVFDKIMIRDAVCWTSLIAGYAQHGYGEKALKCFDAMKLEGFSPNVVTYVCALKACFGGIQAYERGQDIHAEIVSKGFLDTNAFIGNALVDMYIKLGKLDEAREVFDTLRVRDTVTWTVLISGYTQYGHSEKAVECFQMIKEDGVSPDATTFACILKACGRIGILKGREIHAQIVEEGQLAQDLLVANALVDMYAKCGMIEHAQVVFNDLCVRDIVSWNSLISGYVQHGKGVEAIDSFEQMMSMLIAPDCVTFICTLKACGLVGMVKKGKEIHAEIVKQQLLGKSVLVGNALVDMYMKCHEIEMAQNVFDGLPLRDVITWNTLIAGYIQHGHSVKALHCFQQMQEQGVHPNAFTFASVLKACASLGKIGMGQMVHAMICNEDFINKDEFIANALVDLYAKCSKIATAKSIFDELRVRDVISWTVLIGAYIEQEYVEDALHYFQCMQHQGVCPNEITFAYILKGCGTIGAAKKAEEMHASIDKTRSKHVGNVLVDMYAKCGAIEKAKGILDELLLDRDVVSWNALIAGYSLLGKDCIVFDLFKKMSEEGVKLNAVSFVIMLNTCSHSGLVHLGQACFRAMQLQHGIMPTLDHQNCMVDLFGRAGQFDRALSFTEDMGSVMDVTPWHILLGASQKWGNVEVGKVAFEHAKECNEHDGAAYALMNNIYATAHIKEAMVNKYKM